MTVSVFIGGHFFYNLAGSRVAWRSLRNIPCQKLDVQFFEKSRRNLTKVDLLLVFSDLLSLLGKAS